MSWCALASGSRGRVDTGFPWNIPEPALDLAPLPDLFEAAGGVYPTNPNLGHVACRVMTPGWEGCWTFPKYFDLRRWEMTDCRGPEGS